MLRGVAELVPLVVPLHPRGRPTLEAAGLRDDDRLRIVDPLGYVEFLSLVRGAALVVTDSGGIQEETTILGVPCLTVRPNTERPDHDHPRHQPAGRCRGRGADGPGAPADGDLVLADGRRRSGTASRGADRGRHRHVARARQDRRSRGCGPAGLVTGTGAAAILPETAHRPRCPSGERPDAPRPAPRTTTRSWRIRD